MKKAISTSDIFVKKIGERSDPLISRTEIARIWVLSGGSKARLSYAMSLLLGRDIIEALARDLYMIENKNKIQPAQIDELPVFPAKRTVTLVQQRNPDDFYWEIVAKLIDIHSPSGGIIGGEKSLELHLKNYEIPETLIIYTRNVSLRIRLSSQREIHFRTLASGPKTGKKNLFRLLGEHSTVHPANSKLSILSLEAALLDALSLRRHDTGIEEASILRFLRQYSEKLDRTILGELTRSRYIRAMNRLRRLSRDNGYDTLYEITLDIIKNEGGGCFLNI